MGTYIELGPVTTWYEELGEGEPLVLLHGRLVDARFFSRTLPPLAEHFHVYLPERRWEFSGGVDWGAPSVK